MIISKLPLSLDYDHEKNRLVLLDQTKLPLREEFIQLKEIDEIVEAIKNLRVRGAPAIGLAAAIGIGVVLKENSHLNKEAFVELFQEALIKLKKSRPTAVNLTWALAIIERDFQDNIELSPQEIAEICLEKALNLRDLDKEVCFKIGLSALSLLKKGMGLLTHCNAGHLATSAYGTATAPMYLGQEQGYDFTVYCDETRPLLQGARLTTYELNKAGIKTHLLCDDMAASLMAQGKVDAILVGCDRVAANGDTANKIGTLNLGILAKYYNIPFYVCAPTSTIDLATPTGAEIVIEERAAAEVTEFWYANRMAPEKIEVYNPAFDVTPADLITAFCTEEGVLKPPFDDEFRRVFAQLEKI